MPQVTKERANRNNQMNKADIKKTAPETMARDNLRTAYSGNENKGPTGRQKTDFHSDRVKGRRIAQDSGKTPIR